MPILRMFPTDAAVPMSDTAKARIAERARVAPEIRGMLLSSFFTGEAYGVARDSYVDPSELMTPPAEVRWGPQFFDKTCEDMRRNVLEYGALTEKAKDIGEHLPGEWVAGEPGDAESEAAREEVETAWNAVEELGTAMRGMGDANEKGFRGGELVWDVLNRGKVQDYIAPVAIIPRPAKWFGFDYFGRPRFRRDASRTGDRNLPPVPDFKVLFQRMGDLHTPYGHGHAIDCYPTVWAIDENRKLMAKLAERWGYLPMVVTYPQEWPDHGASVARLNAAMKRRWPNCLIVPGAVPEPKFDVRGTEGTSAANTTIQAMLLTERARLEELSHFILGTMQSSGNQQEGSFARDAIASTDLMFKAPTYAGAREATCNRLVKMLMLANRPTLEEHKWPRRVIDSSFGEDLRLFAELCELGAKMGMRISRVTYSERTGIPQAADDDENILEAPSASNPFAAPELPAAQGFAEPTINIQTKYGLAHLPPDFPVMIEGRGPIRAAQIQPGMTMVGDPKRLRLVR